MKEQTLNALTVALTHTQPDATTPLEARREWQYLTLSIANELQTVDPHFDYVGFLNQVGFYRLNQKGD